MTRKKVLTPSQVRQIRAMHVPHVVGHGYREIARKFNVGESTIRDCVKYWTYAGVR